jgi:hypothetical protein
VVAVVELLWRETRLAGICLNQNTARMSLSQLPVTGVQEVVSGLGFTALGLICSQHLVALVHHSFLLGKRPAVMLGNL